MTNQTNKSFIIHKDSLSILDQLTDEQAGKLFKAINQYQKTGEIGDVDQLIKIAINPFINQFSRDEIKYKTIIERNKINGLKGGRPKNPENPVGYLETQKKQTKPKKAYSKSDSDSDSKSDNKNEIINNFDNQFESFWESYKPIHTGKGNKEKSKQLFLKALKTNSLESINQGLDAYMKHCQAKNSYTKSVEVWLRNECWNDEYSGIVEPARGKTAELRGVFQQFLDQDNG